MDYAAKYTTDLSKEFGWKYYRRLTNYDPETGLNYFTKTLRKIVWTTGTMKVVGFRSASIANDYLNQLILENQHFISGEASASGGGMWEISYTYRYGEWVIPAVYKETESDEEGGI